MVLVPVPGSLIEGDGVDEDEDEAEDLLEVAGVISGEQPARAIIETVHNSAVFIEFKFIARPPISEYEESKEGATPTRIKLEDCRDSSHMRPRVHHTRRRPTHRNRLRTRLTLRLERDSRNS